MIRQQKGNSNFILIVGLLVLTLLVAGIGYYFDKTEGTKNVSCTMEAKICPDGSSVGRTGPNCEFAACPEINTSDWNIFKNDKYGIEFKYPKIQESKGNDSLRIYYTLHGSTIYDFKILSNDQKLSLEDFFIYSRSKTMIGGFNKNKLSSVEKVIIGEQNIEAAKIVWSDNVSFLIPKGDIVFQFDGSPAFDDKEFLSVFNTMLSTFKFTK